MSAKTAASRAVRLLRAQGVAEPPVDVHTVAAQLGIEVRDADLEDEVSGMLLRRGQRAVIVVNRHHARSRQRFTVAHEIGHFLLHPPEETHLDLIYRDTTSSTGEDAREREANVFAANLLMPAYLIRIEREALLSLIFAEDPDDKIRNLAAEFQVSPQAMTYRLTNLGLLD